MIWQHFSGLQVAPAVPGSVKRRYSITSDVLAYQLCSTQYHGFAVRKYEPALAVQLFYGTVIHQVLDQAHAHYQGRIEPRTKGTIPTDQDIEHYFQEVENSLRARRIRALPSVRDQALDVLKRFNVLEGPTLYPRVVDTECHLQTDQGSYILHGNVDVLYNVAGHPGDVEIWDYKGAEMPSRNSPRYQEYVFQMQVYAELYRQRTGRTPHRAKLYFLNELKGLRPPTSRPINAVLEVSLDPATVQTAMSNFDMTVHEIEQSRATSVWLAPKNAPPKETCQACDLRWNCRAAQRFGRTYQMIYP